MIVLDTKSQKEVGEIDLPSDVKISAISAREINLRVMLYRFVTSTGYVIEPGVEYYVYVAPDQSGVMYLY
jgi:hypothetical protein